MNYTRLFRAITLSLRIAVVAAVALIIVYRLSRWLLAEREMLYLVLFLPVVLMILFGVVAFALSEILRQQSWTGSGAMYRYTRRELMSLYGRSYVVVVCVVGMAMLFEAFADASTPVSILFHVLDLFLLFYGVGSIVKGEKLRELNVRAIQSENALLKGRLNPHFLYNTLNNIDALIAYDADKASEAVLKLSSLLRYITYQGERREVTLGEEMTHLGEYIDLQRLRLANPAALDFSLSLADPSLTIAPMMLMPFIENVFKHAADRRTDGAIRIAILSDSDSLTLTTVNRAPSAGSDAAKKRNFEGPRAMATSGVGLYAVERRLSLLYPGRYTLQAGVDADGFYRLSLNILIRKKQ